MIFIKLISQAIDNTQNVVKFDVLSDSNVIYSGGLNFSKETPPAIIKDTLSRFAKAYAASADKNPEVIPENEKGVDIPADDCLIPETAEQAARSQVFIYGHGITGDETSLLLAKYKKIKSLKDEMRSFLATEIGDYGDNITDITRAIVLGEAIRMGVVTDKVVTDAYASYIETLLAGYGGEKAIIGTLQQGLLSLGKHLVGMYYPAKAKVEAAEDEAGVEAVAL